MDIRPIRTDADHAAALKEIERLWGAKSGSRNGDKLEVLVTLVEAYENSYWPVEPADPIETLKAHMEMTGRTQADLASLLGSRSRASEILSRRRPLTLSMIHKISREWHLPAEVLVQPYKRGLKTVAQRLPSQNRDQLAEWLDQQLKLVPGKSELAGSIRYTRSPWEAEVAYFRRRGSSPPVAGSEVLGNLHETQIAVSGRLPAHYCLGSCYDWTGCDPRLHLRCKPGDAALPEPPLRWEGSAGDIGIYGRS